MTDKNPRTQESPMILHRVTEREKNSLTPEERRLLRAWRAAAEKAQEYALCLLESWPAAKGPMMRILK
jgi:hypothetical protein